MNEKNVERVHVLPYTTPGLVYLEITNKCNFKCIYCYNDANGHEMSAEEIRKTLIPQLDAARIRTLCLIGGEPLLRLKDIIQIATDLNKIESLQEIMIATNGYLLTDTVYATITKSFPDKLVYFAIPLDSIDKDIVSRYRPPKKDVFEKTMAAIQMLKKKRAIFTIETVVTKETLSRLPEMINFVKSLGKRVAMEVFPFHPIASGADQRHLALDNNDLKILDETRIKNLGNPILPWDNAPCPYDPRLLAGITKLTMTYNVISMGCLAGNNALCIEADGTVIPCNYFREPLGNIFETTLMDIYDTHPLVQKLRNREVGGKCGTCKHVVECGGCRARAKIETGDWLGGIPSCEGSPEGHRLEEIANVKLQKASKFYMKEIKLFEFVTRVKKFFKSKGKNK